jgi:hypothetical protein
MSIQRLSNAGQSGFRYKSLIAGITPVASVPVIGEATAVTFSTASVAFTAPGAYAGSTYTATSSPGGFTGTSASSPITVSGLSGDTAYTFTVTATNATGTSGPSAASNSITTPAEFTPESGYDALATVTVPSGGLASVDFLGIPTGYKHLQVHILGRTDRSANVSDGVLYRLNNDTSTSNYTNHYVGGDGSSTFAGAENGSWAGAVALRIPGAGAASNVFGTIITDILDVGSTSKYKTLRSLGGQDLNGSGEIYFGSNAWLSTTAVTSLVVVPRTGTNFVQHTQIALYGIK